MLAKGTKMDYYLLLLIIFSLYIAIMLTVQTIRYFRFTRRFKEIQETAFPTLFTSYLDKLPHYTLLDGTYKKKIHTLILLFLDQKEFREIDCMIDEKSKIIIAFYASLLHLGFEFMEFDTTKTIIIYKEEFIAPLEHIDGGVYHSEEALLEGESSENTVVLSLTTIAREVTHPSDANLIIHEFAHQLFSLFNPAFLEPHFDAFIQNAHDGILGSYAAQNLQEFFAVSSERFFMVSQELRAYHPELYEALSTFYRLDTAMLFRTD